MHSPHSRRTMLCIGAAMAVTSASSQANATSSKKTSSTSGAPIIAFTVGQSLAVKWATPGYPGIETCAARMAEYGEPRHVSVINGAAGGTSLLKRTRPAEELYWWDHDLDQPGPMAKRAERILRRQSVRPTMMILNNGQSDSGRVAQTGLSDDEFVLAFANANMSLITFIRNIICSDVPVFVDRLGPREGSMNKVPGQALVRRSQDLLTRRTAFSTAREWPSTQLWRARSVHTRSRPNTAAWGLSLPIPCAGASEKIDIRLDVVEGQFFDFTV